MSADQAPLSGDRDCVEEGQPRPWGRLALLVLAVLMTAIDMTVLFLAMPSIEAELDPSGTQQLWVLHSGELVGAGLVLTAGRVVDRFGARKLMALSLLAYAAASLLASLAVSAEMLIAARMLLGAATVCIVPAAMVLTRRMWPPGPSFATAVSLLMAAFSAGMALGPLLGGLLLQHFWWGAVFLVNVPIALLILIGTRSLPRVAGTGRDKIDAPSVVLSLLGLIAIVYGGQELAARPDDAFLPAAAILAGVVAMITFVRRQYRLSEPLLDLRLFASAPFTLALLAIAVVIAADVGAEVQLAQHLQLVLGLDPPTAGLMLAIPALTSVATTAVAPQLLRWLQPATVVFIGALVAASAALAVVLLAGRAELPIGWLVVAVSLVAAGMAPVFALATATVLENAPPQQTGTAQSIQDASGGLSNTIGIALTGAVAFTYYSASMSSSGATRNLTESQREQVEQNVTGGLRVADQLPAPAGSELRDLTLDALAGATTLAYAVATFGFLVVAVLALALRRSNRQAERVPLDPA